MRYNRILKIIDKLIIERKNIFLLVDNQECKKPKWILHESFMNIWKYYTWIK